MQHTDSYTGLICQTMYVGEYLHYNIDLSAGGYVIDSLDSIEATSRGLVAEVDPLALSTVELSTDAKIYFWVAGGTVNEDYQITASYTTAEGESIISAVILKCRQLGFA